MLKLEKTQKIKNVWVSALRGACLRNQVHDRPDMLSKLVDVKFVWPFLYNLWMVSVQVVLIQKFDFSL